MSVLNQTVTNFAALAVMEEQDVPLAMANYISAMDQQQLVDLLSYCIRANPYAEGMPLPASLFVLVRDHCLAELMKRAVSEPF